MTPEERQKMMEERLKNMTPEERAAFEERRKQREAGGGNFAGGNFGGRGGQPGGGGGNFQRGQGNSPGPRSLGEGGGGGQPSGGGNRTGGTRNQPAASPAAASTSATTIDALFAPLQPVETRGRVWLYVNKQLKPVDLRLGISDGTYTEVLNDPQELAQNTEVVTSIITPEMQNRPAGSQGQANNPLMPQRGRGPGGPGQGGGGRGGGR
jgi:hypothetical protein